jgi:ABC-type Mn2+/Zn2+ transport system permease subunit
VGIILCFLGLVFSYYFNIPSGATIIILSSISYLITALIKSRR